MIVERNLIEVHLPILKNMRKRWYDTFGADRVYYCYDSLIKEIEWKQGEFFLPQEDEGL